LGGHEQMDLQSIELALLASDLATGSCLMIEVCMRNTIMITDGYRKALHDVD
jgi:hypothetical protein